MRQISAQCVIVGGGPAGVMLGYLLARSGIRVAVLEKHEDFFRDFRGDTIHASTLDVLAELGILDEFLALPHQELDRVSLSIKGDVVDIADFSRLETRCKFIAFMPQWDFLNFLTSKAKEFDGFNLLMQCECDGLITDGGRTVGVRAKDAEGPLEVRGDLVVAADGRHSTVRELSGLVSRDFGVPIDVLWMRIPKPPGTLPTPLGYIDRGSLLVLIDRGDYYQAGFLISKDGFPEIQAQGLGAFQQKILRLAPFLQDCVAELDDWEKVSLLSVKIDRLDTWHRDGLLCIGDAAHAMSPAGGIGINLAIQDAVAAANMLEEPLRQGRVGAEVLQALQHRREPPTKSYQRFQVFLHRFLISTQASEFAIGVFRFVLKHIPAVGRRVAHTVAVGLLPEHVRKPEEPK